MSHDLIAEEARPVYGKDLHGDKVSFTIRTETEGLEHGDQLRIRLEKLNKDGEESYSEAEDSGLKEVKQDTWFGYIIRVFRDTW